MDDFERQKQEHLEEVQRREQAYLEELEAKRQEETRRQEEERRRQQQLAGLAKGYAKKELGLAAGRLTRAGGKVAGRAIATGARAAAAAAAEAIAAAAPAIGTVLLVIGAIVGIVVLVLIILTAICNAGGPEGTLARYGSTLASPIIGSDACKVLSGGFGGIINAIGSGQLPFCSNPQSLAAQNNTPYPRQDDPDLDRLIDCIKNRAGSTGEISTYDKTHDTCNYSRGQPLCEACSHSPSSCHYGGISGTSGAQAVDFGDEKNGQKILQAATSCSTSLNIPLNRATCEDDNASSVPCSNPGATHLHISLGKCITDNGPINSQ